MMAEQHTVVREVDNYRIGVAPDRMRSGKHIRNNEGMVTVEKVVASGISSKLRLV